MSAFVMALMMSGVAQGACVVADGGEVYTSEGLASGADVVWVDTRIVAVGKGLADLKKGAWKGEACQVVDATGLAVTPGFIETRSSLGLVEVGMEPSTRDGDAGGDDPIRAALRVADAYNPRSSLVPIQRVEGVTSALVLPSGGQISGQAAYVVLAGATQAEAVVDASVAVVASIGGSSRAEGLRRLRAVLQDAREFRRLKGAWERNQTRPLAASGADLEALWPVVDGDQALIVAADRAADIEALLRLQADLNLRLVIHGAAEGWMHAEALADAGVAVVIDPLVYGPGSFNQIHGRADNGALLVAAGVDVIIATGSSHNARNLGQYAGNAVRGGMKPADALAAITSAPAKVYGLEDRGVLEVGARADVVIWSGQDPLELSSLPVAVFIDGRPIALESRQTLLRDAYSQLPGTPTPPLSLPE